MGYARMYGPLPGEVKREVSAPVHVGVHEQAMLMSRRQWSRFPIRVLMMAVVALCGFALYSTTSGEHSDAGHSARGVAALRRLHSPTNADTGEPDPNAECIDGLSLDEVYERDSIGPFQVLTQKKYMLTIYGCAGHRDGEDLICLRDEYLWMLPVYLIGILYMFAGLAIICDEFFVPALELFTEELGLTPDVAGATFMAAGGSMPELFTSFIGTFNETDIGFAAIVGSAVFNVLFVIAVCTLASKEPLDLTWWPLFRDVSWYLLALTLVAFVFKGTSPGEIENWEAVLLLATYLCYATFMKFNPQIEVFVARKLGHNKVVPADCEKADAEKADAEFNKPSTFRVGIFQLLTQNANIAETAGIAAVTKIKGNLQETYNQFDKDGDNLLSEEEVIEMLKHFGQNDTALDRQSIADQLKRIEPRTGDGSISFEAFQKWYIVSETRVAIEVQRVFELFDADKSGTIDRCEVRELLASLGHRPTDEDVTKAIDEMAGVKVVGSEGGSPDSVPSDGNKGTLTITFPQFDKWYAQSVFWQEQHQHHLNEQQADSGGFSLDMPEGATKMQLMWYFFTYPIAAMMYCTMPDVRREGSATFRKAILEFCASLMWIAIFSLCLYDWLVTFCNTIGFPPNVAAVTVLAGGTSIPDLLSSYVVAKQGQGDMAVSSSIGSNIFDVTVGLPLPWLLFTLVNGRNVVVGSNSLFSSIIILILMLIGVIGTVMACKWRLSKPLGGVMMVLYVVFVLQQMLQDFNVINYGI